MTLPWNRGGEADRTPAWVDLLPVVGGAADGTSGEDRAEASEPVLVAPHRDPGEDAVNLDMPPGFESARKRGAAPEGSTTPAAESDARSSAPGVPEAAPAADRTTDEAAATGDRRDAGGPGPGSAEAATPSPATLESIVGDDAGPSSTGPEPATASDGTDDPVGGDAAEDGSDARADEVDEPTEESRERDDRSDTMPVNGT